MGTRYLSRTPTTWNLASTPSSAQVTNADFSDRDAVQRLADSWLQTNANRELMARLDTPHLKSLPANPKDSWTASFRQLGALIKRAAMNNARDPAAYAFRYASVRKDRSHRKSSRV